MATSVPTNPFEDKLNEIKAHRDAERARKFDRAAKGVIWGATDLVAVTALALGAWSNQTVANWLGIPGYAGWAAALVIDGIWLVSLAIVQLHRKEPWRALSAYQATLGMVGLSAVTNFAHGLIRFGWSWRGAAAGLLFALLPVGLKWLITVSTKNSMGLLLKAPDAKNRIRQAGQISAELDLNQVLEPVRTRMNRPEPPVSWTPEPEKVTLERVEFDIPEWVNPVQIPSNQKLELEPAKVPEVPKVVPPTVQAEPQQFNTKQDRVTDLAKRISDRGGQLNSVTFADLSSWYGIDPAKKSTLSNLRKAGHQAYLDGVSTGLYL